MREWTIRLPWTRPPLSLNDRAHWTAKARATSAVRRTTADLLRVARIPALPACTIELHYAPRDARRRDIENFVATLKACADALMDAEIVPDDTPQYVSKPMPVLHEPTGRRAGLTWLIVREGLS